MNLYDSDFEKLDISPIKKNIFISDYIVNTNEGVKYIAPKKLECQYCGTTNPDEFSNHSHCKKCRNLRDRQLKNRQPLCKKLYINSRNSKTHGKIEYDLTPEYIQSLLEKQNYKCFYTGVELKDSESKFEKATIDRIDSSKGYVKGNIVICTWSANNIKNDMSIEDLYNQIDLFKNNENSVKEKLESLQISLKSQSISQIIPGGGLFL